MKMDPKNRHERQGRFWMAKMTSTMIQHGPKGRQMGITGHQNRFRIQPRSNEDEFKNRHERQGRFLMANMDAKMTQHGPKRHPKSM